MSHPLYSSRLDEAVVFALDQFRTRVRKGTNVPYMTHLLSVMTLVGEYGGDEEQMIAAVLHDYLEDIPGAKAEYLVERFGEKVTAYVLALSDSTGHPKPPWRTRKEQYLSHLSGESPELKLISCADKLHNCGSIRRDHQEMGDVIFSRFTGGKEGTLWYYRAVTAALGENWHHPLLTRLREEVEQLHHQAGA